MNSAETSSPIEETRADKSECKTLDEPSNLAAAIATISVSLCVHCWVLLVLNPAWWFVVSMVFAGLMYTRWRTRPESG